MSILIKGMEMPKSCDECQFCDDDGMCEALQIDLLGDGEELENSWYIPEGYKSNRCPLVPVPPHGRLIDADALAEDLDFDVENDQRALDDMYIVGNERTRLQFDKDCKQNCIWYLSEAPTIIEAEGEK